MKKMQMKAIVMSVGKITRRNEMAKDDIAINIKVNPESIGKLEEFHQQSEAFRQEYLGSWGPIETQDSGNKPDQGLWDTFSVLCYRINQPCARCKAEAQPGEWYLSLCDSRDWNIMEKTEEGSKQVFNMGGLRAGDMRVALHYASCFVFQHDQNNQEGE